jgi:phage replication-related protein YjqB (UPF0714/DUF867 family)
MAAYNASIKKALDPEQKDLIKHKEHCSADPEKLATVGRALWHQVRIKRNDDEYGLYTVSEVRQENPDNIVRMGKGGRERLGTSDEFDGTLNSQVPDPTLSDADAERDGEFVERLDDDGAPTGLIAIAPHGGDIEPYTDQQAERVRSQLAGKGVSSWRCKGWHPKGALDHWHITSTDIHEASFPLLNSVISRGFSHAVAFHGFDDNNIRDDILVGGLACQALKEKIKGAIEGVVGSDFTVHITKPDDRFGGDDKRNIVNRLTAGGRHGIQIEQKMGPREKYAVTIAEAVAKVYDSELGLPTITNEQSASQEETRRGVALVTPSQGNVVEAPPTNEPSCPTCGSGAGSMPVSHIYAIGRIKARFPRLSVEKEFAQAAGRAETAGQTDQQTFYNVLSKPESRYLARQICWVLMIQGLETYIVQPRDPRDFDRLVEAIRPQPSPMDIDAVIGTRGPIAPPEFCNGLMVPIVVFDQIYSFDRDALIKAIPPLEKMTARQFEAAAGEVLDSILQMTDNAGATDDHRALDYLAMRYPGIYAKTAEEFARDFSLTGVDVLPSPLSGTRKIVDVIFSYTNRNTDFTEKFFVRCDTTEEFPFLVTKLSPYYDR